MERISQGDVAGRILGSANPVVLVRGPARSGKTSVVLEIYRRCLGESMSSACYLVLPNAEAVQACRERLLEQSDSGVLVSPRIMTFTGLAGAILSSARMQAKPIGAFRRRLVIRQVLDELNRQGRLKSIASVADTPGVVVSLDRSIAEIKRAAVEPDQLSAALDPRDAKSADLLSVYRGYQEALQEAEAFDLEGRMWLARDILRRQIREARELPILRGVSVLAVDGFTDFTPTQLEILSLLSSGLDRLVITIALAGDGRERMWQWTEKTAQRLSLAFGDRMELLDFPPQRTAVSGVWERVFVEDQQACDPPEGISIIAAAGPDREVSAVARRVKRLILDGAGPGSIAVCARSMDSYRSVVERVFAEGGIPVNAAARPLNEIPVVRYLFGIAALSPEFASRRVLSVIGSSYFRPEALGPYAQAEVAAAEMLIRSGNVISGRPSYNRAAERMAIAAVKAGDEDEAAPSAVSVDAELTQSSHEMLTRLFDLSEKANSPSGLLSVAKELQLRQAALASNQDDLMARDLRAIELLQTSLEKLPASVGLAQAREALSAAMCPAARNETLVAVLDVLEARSLRFDHVFLMGLEEGSFPPKFAESSLIRESDRQRWRSRKVELYSKGDLTAREMLLFYLACSRADKSLTLSYQESGPLGQASQPGPFLLSAIRPLGGIERLEATGLVERNGPGSFLPPTGQIACPHDAISAATTSLFRTELADGAAALGWLARSRPEMLARVARGLMATASRFNYGQCDSFDGRITNPKLLTRLRERFPDRTVFSPRMFNSFGQCPWQFFAGEVLKLRPLAEPQGRMEALTKGLVAHEVLFRTMTELSRKSDGPLRLGKVCESDLLAALDQAVEVAVAKLERYAQTNLALWRLQVQQVRRELSAYLLDQKDKVGDSSQMHFELGFGLARPAADDADPASSSEPIMMTTQAGNVRVRGRIDRVDRLDCGEGDLFVVDYKTSTVPAYADIDGGRALQVPIYAEAVEQMLLLACTGGAYHSLRRRAEREFSPRKAVRGDERSFRERREAIADTIGSFVQSMKEGRFDALPTHDCPSYCPFRQICHYSPARAELKHPTARSRADGKPPEK